MAWSAPFTAVSNTAYTAAQHNTYVRDNLLETAPAKVTAAGQLIVGSGTNAIAARTPATAVLNPSDTTSSLSYTSTLVGGSVGPSVTVTTGPSALVIITARMGNSTATANTTASYAVSGATTAAASDDDAIQQQDEGANRNIRASSGGLRTGLTAGSNTFTMQYKVSAGTATFASRRITVIPF